ncbi:MAG: phosphate propanoyltransferase [Ruminococcaceae bacterium]|nr:phosphate propanoyltransferase [Oscillospiraceae bacterium]
MDNKFIVETSARHIHVTAETFAKLFGPDAELHNKKDLSQPGQFACEERVTLVGPKGELKVSILGPFRPADQVELSFTDARTLGLKAVPVRESGDVAGAPGLKLVGPCGEAEMAEGTIVAKRHIHMTPADAERLGVSDKEIVKVKLDTDRPVIYDDVVVRVSDKFALAMHIDTDECNAAAAFGAVCGEIIK